MAKTIPVSVTDTIMHVKNTDRTERVILPVTRYANVMNAPNLVSAPNDVKGAPYLFLATDTEEMTVDEVRELVGVII